MKRKIVEIDEAKCTGCGLCANACHEGAIAMVDGKAKLVKDDYCDGMGDCLPECPAGAIKIVEREAAAYDEKAVQERKMAKLQAGGMLLTSKTPPPGGLDRRSLGGGGCPGKMARMIQRDAKPVQTDGSQPPILDSQLRQWPVQIKLVPVKAPWFNGAKLLIAADCTAYAYANFHQELMRGRITIIGCPKLDEGDYTEKLTAILQENDIKELVIVRMEVPCCGGLERAATNALKAVAAAEAGPANRAGQAERKRVPSGKFIPWRVVTVAIDGHIID